MDFLREWAGIVYCSVAPLTTKHYDPERISVALNHMPSPPPGSSQRPGIYDTEQE